jgi:hypothetical protein
MTQDVHQSIAQAKAAQGRAKKLVEETRKLRERIRRAKFAPKTP